MAEGPYILQWAALFPLQSCPLTRGISTYIWYMVPWAHSYVNGNT